MALPPGTTIKEVWMVLKDHRQLAKLMVIQGISQRQLAQKVGWKSHSYLGRLIRGEVKTVDADAAARIAHVFGVGIDDLFLARVSTATAQTGPRGGRSAA